MRIWIIFVLACAVGALAQVAVGGWRMNNFMTGEVMDAYWTAAILLSCISVTAFSMPLIFGNDKTRGPRVFGQRFYALADFNGEVARGIVHTPEYVDRMKKLQAEYDAIRIGV